MRAAVAVALGLTATALSAEEVVRLSVDGDAMIGTVQPVTGPAGPRRPSDDLLVPPRPAILFLHGFLGTRAGPPVAGADDGAFAITARALAGGDTPSLRVDFRGSGDSRETPWDETTFRGQARDAAVAVDWMAARFARPVVVVGWGQGALVAQLLAGRRDDLAGLVLIDPVTRPVETYATLLGEDVVAAGLEVAHTVPVDIALPSGERMSLNGAFFLDVAQVDPLEAVAGFPGPVLVIGGCDGRAAELLDARGAEGDRHEALWLEPDDAGALDPRAVDALIALVTDWLAAL